HARRPPRALLSGHRVSVARPAVRAGRGRRRPDRQRRRPAAPLLLPLRRVLRSLHAADRPRRPRRRRAHRRRARRPHRGAPPPGGEGDVSRLLPFPIFPPQASTFAPPPDALELYGVGKQWMWKFQHLSGQREINELHVPVARPVKVLLTSQDVIHSFYVPAFRVKQDALPGRYTEAWFEATVPGTY